MIVSTIWHRILTHAFTLLGYKTAAESHNHRKAVGGELCYWEAGKSKGCSHQLRPLDESQDRVNFLVYGALLHRSIEKNTHIGMPSTTDTYGFYLSLYVMDEVDNYGLEAKIVGITSDGGGNISH